LKGRRVAIVTAVTATTMVVAAAEIGAFETRRLN